MCSGLIPADTIILLYFSCSLWDVELNAGAHLSSSCTSLISPLFCTPRILSKDTASQITITRVCATEIPNSFSSKITPTRRDFPPLTPKNNTGEPGQQMSSSVLLEVTGWDSTNCCLDWQSYHKQTPSFFRPLYLPAWLLFYPPPPPPRLLSWESLKGGRKEGGKKKYQWITNHCFENSTAQSA